MFCLTFVEKAKNMLTKYYLEIDGTKTEIPTRCIKNWDEVMCAYKRADYSGVTRSFTSQFEFVHEAYDMLMALYLRDGFNAVAILSLYTITDRWEWEKRFEAPVDFSSITWDNYVLKVNCIDNSLAAFIKANKGTKYEFVVGKDIQTSTPLDYDRIPMVESLGYQVLGESSDDSGKIKVTAPTYKLTPPWVGLVDESVAVNGSMAAYGDQDGSEGSHILEVGKDVTLHVKSGMAFDMVDGYQDISVSFDLYRTAADGTNTKLCNLGLKSVYVQYYGEKDDPSKLPGITGLNPGSSAFVKSTGTIWEIQAGPNDFVWVDTGKTFDEYMYEYDVKEYDVKVFAGDKVWIGVQMEPFGVVGAPDTLWINILAQTIEITWSGMGGNETIDTIAPKTLCEKILEKVCMGKLSVNAEFSEYDSRFANTYLLAAESVRAIPGAKVYSSFNEFTDWMQTVFGYTYYLGECVKNPSTGVDNQTIFFVHRSEIFKHDASVIRIANVRDVSYSVDVSHIYSSVTVGYEKQDYESFNGRDEFNFNNTYSTGHNVIEKNLSLISKYRADSYGIEFAVQERGQDTTDNESDDDVFFVLAKYENSVLRPDRSAKINNTISDMVFNGAFSPMACLSANAGYICMQAKELHLAFASSEGNSTIEIDGVPMTSDIEISNPLATCGVIEFTTDDVDEPVDANSLIEIESGGITYRGFLDYATFTYAKNEAAEYKLIVKDIEL